MGIFSKAGLYVSTSAKSELEGVNKMQSFKTKAFSGEQQICATCHFTREFSFGPKKL